MRRGQKFSADLIKCPQCHKHFMREKDLNLHLLRKHGAAYAVRLPRTATGTATPVLRTKRGGSGERSV